MMVRITRGALLSCALLLHAATSLHAAITLETVAITGSRAPGLEATFSRLFVDWEAGFNDLGQVVFEGELTGTGVDSTNDFGLWYYDPLGEVAQVAREGDSVPGGGSFDGYFRPALNDRGELAFIASTSGPSGSNSGIWRTTGPGGGVLPIVRGTEIAPGAGVAFGNFTQLALSDDNQVVFKSGLDSSDPEGFWRSDAGGNISLIALENGDGPGFGTAFASFGGFSMNSAGMVALVSGLVSGGASQTSSIWRDTQAGFQMLAKVGDPAPGASAEFQAFGFGPQPVIDASGQFAFVARLMGPGVIAPNNSSIWRHRDGEGFELFLREGEDGPTGGTEEFGDFGSLRQNSLGEVAFAASLQVGTSWPLGLWKETALGNVTLVALGGETAPGTSLLFNSLQSEFFSFNDLGQVAFLAEIIDPTTSPRPTRLTGIWAQDVNGQLQKIALEGESIDVSDDPATSDFRTIQSLTFGLGDNLNNLGQVLFTANFTDGSSGAFISNLVAVPEPSSLALLILYASTLATLRRGRAKA
jgi:hypothetical protein